MVMCECVTWWYCQGCHALVPPAELFLVVRAIANNFVADRCSDEVIQVGPARGCARAPPPPAPAAAP